MAINVVRCLGMQVTRHLELHMCRPLHVWMSRRVSVHICVETWMWIFSEMAMDREMQTEMEIGMYFL